MSSKIDLTQALAKLGIASYPKSATSFPRFSELPAELRLKIYRYAGMTARNDRLHCQYWHNGTWQASGGYPADASPNFEALQEMREIYQIPIPDWTYCQCETAHSDGGWYDAKHRTLYSAHTLEWLSIHRRWATITASKPFSTITHLISGRGCDLDIDKIRRVVVEFSAAYLSDCVWKDEYFRILMLSEKAHEFHVGGNSPERTAGELTEVELAGGNLEGIQKIPSLQELMIVVINPGDFYQLGWTKSTALAHILLRVELIRIQHPKWVIPEIRFVENIAEV